MEGRRVLMCLGVLAGIAAWMPARAFDDRSTHPALTQEILRAYNAAYPDDAVSQADVETVMRGSTEEDQLPRPLNHLYDPVHRMGWTGGKAGWVPGLVTRLASLLAMAPVAPLPNVEWIVADGDQQAYARYGGNRSWPAGLRALARGDKEQALLALGSALHLLEDAAVPEHARDDTHVHQVSFLTGDAGSPLENYARRYGPGSISVASVNAADRARIPRFQGPAGYLEDNARYAAASFFSRDTVQDARFPAPQVAYEKDGIAYGRAPDGKEIPLARRVRTLMPQGTTSSLRLGDGREFDTVLEAQFRVIAERTVLLGAGMVRDFRHAERVAGEAPAGSRAFLSLAGEASKLLDRAGSLAASVIGTTRSQAGRAYAWLTGRGTVAIGDPGPAVAAYDAGAIASPGEIAVASGKTGTTASKAKTAPSSPKTGTSAAPAAAAPRCPSAGPQRVVVSEIAWMGTAVSANDEWIELHNLEQDAVDLEGWELRSDGGLYVDLSGVVLPAGAYALLERTDDASVPRVPAAKVYTGALPNAPPAGFSLALSAPGCGEADRVVAEDGWPGGDAASRRTLERSASGSWQTSSMPGGTPGMPNSAGYVAAATSTPKTLPTSTQDGTPSSQPQQDEDVVDGGRVVISEIQAAGRTATDEFVELYNPGDRSVSLAGWSLQYFAATETAQAQVKALPTASVPARGYFLVAREAAGADDGYRGTTTPDFSHKAFSLSGAGAKVALVRSAERVATTTNERVADAVRYPALSAGQSYERAAAGTGSCSDPRPGAPGELQGNGCQAQEWFVREMSEPQNARSLAEPREGVAAPPDSATSTAGETWLVMPLEGVPPESAGRTWSMLVAWQGTSTPPQEITTATQLTPDGIDALRLEYLACAGTSIVARALLLPISREACQNGGELSGAYAGDFREDARIVVKVLARLVPGEILRLARYAFGGGGGGLQRFVLDAVQDMPVVLGGEPPGVPGRFRAESGEGPSTSFSWEAARDPDNVDAGLAYELRLSQDGPWEDVGQVLTIARELAPGAYRVAVRARDPQGNVGEPAETTFSVVAPAPSEQFAHDATVPAGEHDLIVSRETALRGIAVWIAPEGGPYCCSNVRIIVRDAAGAALAQGEAGRRVVDGEGEAMADFGTTAVLGPGRYRVEIGLPDQPRNSFSLRGSPDGKPFLRFLRD